MKKEMHDDGVIVNHYDGGRIKVKLPTRKFEYLKSLYSAEGSPKGIYEFLRKCGFPYVCQIEKEQGFEIITNLKVYIEQRTGHVCYVYRPPKEKVVRVEPEDTVEDPAPVKPKPKPKPKKKVAK